MKSKKILSLIFAIFLIVAVWGYLDYKLIFGEDWISPTYDREGWTTNEGDLHTFGAWDLETHIWKSEYIVENFPNFQYNPYWYMGMPLLKYYQSGFYILNIGLKFLLGVSFARAALLLVVFSHLVATLLTFLVCYKVSKGKEWVSAFLSIFLLSLNFIGIRSYGWEPITVVFLFLYPLGLYYFLKEPKRPLRLSLIFILAISYLCHPLIWFSLCMTFGLYLFSLAIFEKDIGVGKKHEPYIMKYFILVFLALLISAVQFLPQMSYSQVTSGSHMGVSYLPFYHIQYNVIPISEFLFDAKNLKGPGFIIWVAFGIFLMLFYAERKLKKRYRVQFDVLKESGSTLFSNDVVRGFGLVLLVMVLFYYLELYNIFPMNLLRSIQYHRIIPEFVIASAVLIAAMSNLINSEGKKIFYYSIILGFLGASMFIVYDTQEEWKTVTDIGGAPEFIYDDFEGRITFPYTDQSLAVRNSFTKVPQIYGYYEQGVTNSYADELFSVSSGFHDLDTSLVYLKAANVARIYVNKEEGKRDEIVEGKFNQSFDLVWEEGDRYGYFEIPLKDASMVQAISLEGAFDVQRFQPNKRNLFQEEYFRSEKEEFASSDFEEVRYLEKYNDLLEKNFSSRAEFVMVNPENYRIEVYDATMDTGVVLKLDYDEDFSFRVNGIEVDSEEVGPEFILIKPNMEGDYVVEVEYNTSKIIIYGGIISLVSLVLISGYFVFRRGDGKGFLLLKGGNLR